MRIARTVEEVRGMIGGRVGFVPTMGALHGGHLSLIQRARAERDLVVVSLFVNPLQFGPGEDYQTYPRRESEDAALAEGAGADVLFVPEASNLVKSAKTLVKVGRIAEIWEGAFRPEHFTGVATIVCKFFNIIGNCSAYFGAKDYQQCAVIQQMIEDLNMPIDLHVCPTVREADGLALSSRNAYLSRDERRLAPSLYRSLITAREGILALDTGATALRLLEKSRKGLEKLGFAVDYFAYVDPKSLEALASPEPCGQLLVAAKIGSTRLIDNVSVIRKGS